MIMGSVFYYLALYSREFCNRMGSRFRVPGSGFRISSSQKVVGYEFTVEDESIEHSKRRTATIAVETFR